MVLLIIVAYVGAHFILSRLSARLVMRDWGFPSAFIYLPVRPDVVADHEIPLLQIHLALRYVFYPAWKLDHACGGPRPMTSMPMRGIEGVNPAEISN